MGLYINPPNQTKEEWLKKHGAMTLNPPEKYKMVGSTATYWAVVLLFNTSFTAAGIAFSPSEFEAFQDLNDDRAKIWFLVEEKDLLSMAPDLLQREKEALERGRW